MANKMASKTRIKIEDNNTSLIQSYINTFNKEIEENGSEIGVSQCTVIPSNVEIREVEANEENAAEEEPTNGTYFVDNQGRYYYQTDSQQVITSVDHVLNGGNQIMLAEDSNNEMLVDTAEGFQTITLVPSEDVSYVFVVQQGDEKSQNVVPEIDSNLTVYDFDENEDMDDSNHKFDSIDEDDKMKTFTKKQQPVTKPHMCSYCSYTTSKKYLLSRHMKSHSDERPHKCTVCARGFKTLASLQNHVNTHTGTKPHKCRFCGSAFTTSGELVRHVRYRHTHEKPHKCDECEYASVELSKLKRHARCHTGERPFQCPHCTYASPDTFKLKRHLRTHTGEKPYVCEYCNMCFTQSNSLKAHKLRHNIAEKPVFACELCPTTCGRKTDLRIHIQKLHTSDKPLKCRRCGKSFPDRYTFKTHIKTHDGEKCFKCDMCPYASASVRHLSSHMLVHTDEKPYACDNCEQSFRQKQLLRRHQNLYHNPEYIPPLPKEKTQECVECGKHFRHKGNLIRHMAMHDPESGVHEQSLQLKLGRQRKVQLNSMFEDKENDDEEEEEEYEEEESKDPNDDMPHYVVFEVIQMPEDTSNPMTIKDDENEGESTRFKSTELANGKDSANTEKDVENCFGFDVENTEDDLPDQKLSLYDMKLLRE